MKQAVALVDRAPEPIRRMMYRVAAGQGLLGRIADAARFRYGDADIPKLTAPSEASPRVAIGPANSAGQGGEWARAIERFVEGAEATALGGLGGGPFDQAVDIRIPVAVHRRARRWHAELEEWLSHHTHVIWESGLPLLGRRYGLDPGREVGALRHRGVAPALMFHGSDIRPPLRHAAQSEWSPFSALTGTARAMADQAHRNAELAARLEVPLFVSTPDLLQWLPSAQWCPVVINVERWGSRETPGLDRSTPRVVHVPSNPWLKGTALVEPILRRLSAEGLIEYHEVRSVPHDQVPALVASADIVVDQFALGIYGVAACEAMASGALVMSHVDAPTRELVHAHTGLELPVVEATPATLESRLRDYVSSPDAYVATREAGQAFVREVHDGRRSVHALKNFLGITD